MNADAPLLEFHHAMVALDGAPVLDSTTATMRAGENVAVLGPNGSGRSTLTKLCA